ncbi:MAG: nucleotidyl transferase AbiEii/AbiGii toxin family protein [Armatimonadetes bacterium]|nr:nucleotidyl transferase AbiEii/AbiGii toxin family protein [Armatimonadota bacterium]
MALVEKDYWVTHALWSLEKAGFRVWFKGGTSLSKGFGLIERFSEDLDVKLEADGLPEVTSWRSEGVKATNSRQEFFEALKDRLLVPGAEVSELTQHRDRSWRNVVFAVRYPSERAGQLPEGVWPFVQLEVGSARVTPGETRAITSWVHEYLVREVPEVAESVFDNRPTSIHCVLPEVTCLEKIEAISRRYNPEGFDPAAFVRHYEDVERILAGDRVPGQTLLEEMKATGDIRVWPSREDAAFTPGADPGRWEQLESAWRSIDSLFWGDRIPLEQCARRIRQLVGSLESTATEEQ